jgi:hypothetical protein
MYLTKKLDGKGNSLCYNKWYAMKNRCYSPKYQYREAYSGCTVCPEWMDYQVFAEWYHSQPFAGDRLFHLDKDLTVFGNKEYSPSTCYLVRNEVNCVLADNYKQSSRDLPKGVYSKAGWYKASLCKDKFKCPEEAHKAYVVAKETYVQHTVLKYRHELSEAIFNNLMNWRVNGT